MIRSLLLVLLTAFTASPPNADLTGATVNDWMEKWGAPQHSAASVPTLSVENTANRLRERLAKRRSTVSLADASRAVHERRQLMASSVTVRFAASDGKEIPPAIVGIGKYPLLLRASISANDIRFVLDDRMLRSVLVTAAGNLSAPIDARLLSVTDDKGVTRAVTDRVAEPGYIVDTEAAAEQVASLLQAGTGSVAVPVQWVAGRILREGHPELGDLELLATGVSDFAGSGMGRITNVKKGLSERLRDVIVQPGELFSFNDVIGPMTKSRGWQEAYGIFNARELRMITGGGICQVATTLYRAILDGGFTVVERANHSLYVSYYEKHGVGIDATVLPGKQDLLFRNDTSHPILIQSTFEGFQARVRIYGTDDGRSTTIMGPYFTANATEEVVRAMGPLRANEIAWVQVIRYADGREVRHVVSSRYNAIPRSVVQKYLVQGPQQL